MGRVLLFGRAKLANFSHREKEGPLRSKGTMRGYEVSDLPEAS
jgi:hypothetical protein